MPIYICQGRYSREAIQGMIKSPEDRTEAVSKLAQSVGGKLLSYYVTFGEMDFLLIVEGPNEQAMAATEVNERWQAQMTDYFTGIDGRPPDESFLLLREIFHLTPAKD